MTFKFVKDEIKQRDELITRLTDERQSFDNALILYNQALEKAKDDFNLVIEDFNNAVSAAKEFITDVKERAEGERDDKSDKWLESERGVAVGSWIEALEYASSDFDDIEIDWPEELNPDLPNHAEALGSIPDSADDE